MFELGIGKTEGKKNTLDGKKKKKKKKSKLFRVSFKACVRIVIYCH